MSDLPPLPSAADLRRQVQFASSDGRIWLAGQRMLLMHAASLGTLRRELVQSIGPHATRRLLLESAGIPVETEAPGIDERALEAASVASSTPPERS